ncbi:WD40-repeat-containing domain protein [Lactarius vividus]|nr:WD40-repeat-containing domain protein [Lactarius vividus]
MACQKPPMGSTQIARSQGSRSQPVSVRMAVIRARNVPHIKATFGGKRESFVTIAYGTTTKKTKKQNKERTKSVHVDGRRTADQRLDTFILCLCKKRSRKSDIFSRTHETAIPAESESGICFVLGHANGQAGHSSRVRSVAFSLDDQWIISGSENRTIRVWNVTTGDTEMPPFSGHTGWVGFVGFSPDGQHIVSDSEDRTIHAWNATTGDTEAGLLTGR